MKRSGRTRVSCAALAIVAGLAIVLPGAPGRAAEAAGAKVVTTEDLAPALPETDGAFEYYDFEAQLADGLEVQWSLRRAHEGQERALATLRSRVVGPSFRERETTRVQSPDDYELATGEAMFRSGGYSLSGSSQAIRVTAEEESYGYDLLFEPTVPAWRPAPAGSADERARLDVAVLVPVGRVTGSVRLGTQTTQVEGYGHAYRTRGDQRPEGRAGRWLTFHAVQDGAAIHFWRIEPSPNEGGEPLTWLLVARDGHPAAGSTAPTVRFHDFTPDQVGGQRTRVPSRVTVRTPDIELRAQTLGPLARVDDPLYLDALDRAFVGNSGHFVGYHGEAACHARVTGPTPFSIDSRTCRLKLMDVRP